METLNSENPPELVANLEVMQILEERVTARAAEEEEEDKNRRGKRRFNNKLRQRDWIETKVLEYLQATPCGQADLTKLPALVKRLRGTPPPPPVVTDEDEEEGADENTATEASTDVVAMAVPSSSVVATDNKNTGFGLTDAETLQVLNFMPSESVEIHLMIGELQNRMSDAQQDDLLQAVAGACIVKGEDDDEEEAVQEDDAGDDSEEIVGESGESKDLMDLDDFVVSSVKEEKSGKLASL